MTAEDRLLEMNEMQLNLWFCEQKVLINHMNGVSRELKDDLMKSQEETEKMLLNDVEKKLRIREYNFKSNVCRRLIGDANEDLIKTMEADEAQVNMLCDLKDSIATMKTDIARCSIRIELLKKEKRDLQANLEALKQQKNSEEQAIANDLESAKKLLNDLNCAVNSDITMLDRKKRIDELELRRQQQNTLLCEVQNLEALERKLDDELNILKEMPFQKYCIKLASALVSINGYKKKIADLSSRYQEAMNLKDLNKSMPSQDTEETWALSQAHSSVRFAPKTPSPLIQITTKERVTNQASFNLTSQPQPQEIVTQQRNEEGSILENEIDIPTKEQDQEMLDGNTTPQSLVSSDIEVLSSHGEQRAQIFDEGDATMDESEGCRKRTEMNLTSAHVASQEQHLRDGEEMEHQTGSIQAREHEGSMEENEFSPQSLQNLPSEKSSQDVRSETQSSQQTNTQVNASPAFLEMVSQDVPMEDAQDGFDFGAFGSEPAGTQSDNFLSFANENGNNANASFDFGDAAIENVLDMTNAPNAGESFLNYMENRSGSGSEGNAAFDFDFDGFGNSGAGDNAEEISFNLDEFNGASGRNSSNSAPEDFNFDF